MRKRLMIFFMCAVLSMTTILSCNIHAKALVTSSAGVYEGIMLLLGLTGVKATASEVFDGEFNLDSMLEDIKNNQTYGLALYYWILDKANKIALGQYNIALERDMYQNLRRYVAEKFGLDTNNKVMIGNMQQALQRFQSTWIRYNGIINGENVTYQITGIDASTPYYVFYAVYENNRQKVSYIRYFFIPVPEYYEDHANDAWDISNVQVQYSGYSGYTNSYDVGSFGMDGKTGFYVSFGYQATTGMSLTLPDYGTHIYTQEGGYFAFDNTYLALLIAAIYARGYQEKDVDASPVQGVGGATATSVDQTVVGSGTLVDEENGDIVIGGDIGLNLQNIDIQALLKSLADGQITYEQLVNALGATAVNTATMTAEQIAELVETRTIAQAGINQITGPYTVDLTQFFPFCIPFDIYHLIQAFNANPVAPQVLITIPVGYDGRDFTWEDYTLSLEQFDSVAQVVRIFEYVLFVIGLMLVTRKLIEG